MKPCLLIAALGILGTPRLEAALYHITAGADAYVRASMPESNYGGGGLLNVSGATATNAGGTSNGAFDVFLRFATAATKTQIDSDFGAGLWRITSVSLKLTEVNNPGNLTFNIGPGQFQVDWIGGDGWEEGAGIPSAPSFTGISWDTRGNFLNAATDRVLGIFANTQTGALTANLTLDPSFIDDLTNDAQTSLYLTAAAPMTGFNFRSQDFNGDPSVFPHLEINVEAIPEPSTTALCSLIFAGLLRRSRSVRQP